MSVLANSIVFDLRNNFIPGTVKITAKTSAQRDDSQQCAFEVLAFVHKCGFRAHNCLKNSAPTSGESAVFHRPYGKSFAVASKVIQVVLNHAEVFVRLVVLQALNLLHCDVANISGGSQNHLLSMVSKLGIAFLGVLSLTYKHSMGDVGLPCPSSTGGQYGSNRSVRLDPAWRVSPVGPISNCRPARVDGKCNPEKKKHERECSDGHRYCELRIAVVFGAHKSIDEYRNDVSVAQSEVQV